MSTRDKIEALCNNPGWRHMKPFIYEESNALLVETMCGTECVPCDHLGIDASARNDSVEALDKLHNAVSDYLEGGVVDLESLMYVHKGYVCRMSAPGYMDCTPWEYYETLEEVYKWVEEQAEELEEVQ